MVNGQFSALEASNRQIAARSDNLETRVGAIEQSNDSFTERISALDGRIASVESATAYLSTVEADVQRASARLHSLENRVAGVEQGNSTLEAGSQQIAARSGDLESRVGGIEQNNASFAEQIDALAQRIVEVERRLQVENPVVVGEDGCIPSEVVTENQVGLCLTSLTAKDAVFTWGASSDRHGLVNLRRVDGDGTVIASKSLQGDTVSIAALTPQPSDSGTLLFTPEPGARYILEVQVDYWTGGPLTGHYRRNTGQWVFTMPAN